VRQHRVHHHVAQAALAARLGDLRPLALVRIACVAGRGADEQDELRVLEVWLAVRHALHVTEHRTRRRAIGPAAVPAVPDVVDAAVGLLQEAPAEGLAAVVHACEQGHLVDLGAERRLFGVDGRLQVTQRAQALDRAFAEEVAAFHHFAHQLLQRYRRPLPCPAGPHALERRAHAVHGAHLFDHSVAAPACRGPAIQAAAALRGGGQIALAHRRLERQRLARRQWVVGVAGHAQHLAGLAVQPHPHTALRGAAQATGIADLLCGVDVQGAAAVDAELGCQRVAVQAGTGGRGVG
jgi:hypothetical protein